MFIRRLPLTCQILASDGSNTCVCRLEHLPLSRQRLAAVKQGEGGRHKRLSSLLPDRCKPVHSRNIRPIGCSPSSLEKATAYTEIRYHYCFHGTHFGAVCFVTSSFCLLIGNGNCPINLGNGEKVGFSVFCSIGKSYCQELTLIVCREVSLARDICRPALVGIYLHHTASICRACCIYTYSRRHLYSEPGRGGEFPKR